MLNDEPHLKRFHPLPQSEQLYGILHRQYAALFEI